MYKTNTRLLYSEKCDDGKPFMTLDSYNEKTGKWIEVVVPEDNPIYEKLKEIYMNTSVDYPNLKNLKQK